MKEYYYVKNLYKHILISDVDLWIYGCHCLRKIWYKWWKSVKGDEYLKEQEHTQSKNKSKCE